MNLLALSIDINGILHGLAGAVVSGGVTLCIWLLNRARPSKIVCGILSASPTVEIDDGVETEVEVTYKGIPVKSLAILELVIFNNASQTVELLDLTIQFPPTTRILEFEFPNPRAAQNVATVSKLDDSRLRVQAAYLNSLNGHGDKLLLKLMCDGSLEGLTVQGRGLGWSTVKQNLNRSMVELWGILFMIAGIGLIALFVALLGEAVKESVHPTLRFVLYVISMLFAMAGGMGLPSYLESRKMHRLRN